MTNDYYEAMMEGRYPIPVATTQDAEGWVSTFTGADGQVITGRGTDQFGSHADCTAKVQAAVHARTLVPFF